MSNPDLEIHTEIAHKHAAIVATGRSDFPNQINYAADVSELKAGGEICQFPTAGGMSSRCPIRSRLVRR